MKIATTVMTLAVSGLISAILQADVPERYQTIVDRNSFGLNPPPPPSLEPPTQPVPPANVKLTGFATINGQKKAYFTIAPKDPAKEPQQYLSLSEGERQDALEVISISDQEGEVRVRNTGVEMVLSLKNNGFKPATIAPGMAMAPASGGLPGNSPVSSPVYNPATSSPVVSDYAKMAHLNVNPSSQMQAQPNAASPEAMRGVPPRTLRLNPQNPVNPQASVQTENVVAQSPIVYSPSPTGSPTWQAPQTPVNPARPSGPPPIVFSPTTPLLPTYPSPNQSTPTQPAVDPDIQLAMMQLQQTIADQNGGMMPVETAVNPNPVVAAPPTTRTRWVPAPPMPPLPQ